MNYTLLDVYDQLRADLGRGSALVITNYPEKLMFNTQQPGIALERLTFCPQNPVEKQPAAVEDLKRFIQSQNELLELRLQTEIAKAESRFVIRFAVLLSMVVTCAMLLMIFILHH